jgi:hypothetical protein
MQAKSFCSSYNMDLLSLESPHEMKYFLKACENNFESFEDISFIGGIEENNEWFSTGCGNKINFSESALEEGDNGKCLSLVKKENGTFSFAKIACNDKIHAFICHKMIIKIDHWSDIFGR